MIESTARLTENYRTNHCRLLVKNRDAMDMILVIIICVVVPDLTPDCVFVFYATLYIQTCVATFHSIAVE